MKSRTLPALAIPLSILLAVSLAACGGDTTDSETSTSTPPPAENTPETAAVAEDEETPMAANIVPEYVFTNTGSVEICELYLSPVDDESWGPDQLEEETIPAGEQFTLTNIPAGSYDAKAVGCDDAGEITLQLDISSDETSDATSANPAAIADADAIVPEYVFTNTGSVEICELYLSPVDDESWGPDQLEEETIPVGEQFTLTNIPVGTYDAQAVGCDDAGEVTLQLDITN